MASPLVRAYGGLSFGRAHRLLPCFDRYMREGGHRVSRAMFEENLQKKLFRADLTALLRPGLG